MFKLHHFHLNSFRRLAYLSLFFLIFSSAAQATGSHHDNDGESCDNALSVPLLLEDDTQVGTVRVTQQGGSLKVRYKVQEGWKISKTHLAIESSFDAIPVDNAGNPLPGKFKYKTRHRRPVESVTHFISTSTWPLGTELFIAAHAELKHESEHYSRYSSFKTGVALSAKSESRLFSRKNSETKFYRCVKKRKSRHKNRLYSAWAKGTPFYGNQKAYYFSYVLDSCEPVKPSNIQLDNASYSVDEDGGSVNIGIIRTGDLTQPASVTLSTFDGTAIQGLDYAMVNQTVNFPPNVALVNLEIPVIDDSEQEDMESFNVQLSDAQGSTLGDPVSASVEILDNDEPPVEPAEVSFSHAQFDVNELDRKAVITVVRTGSLAGEITVNFTVLQTSFPAGNATPNQDFIAVSGTLTFVDGADTATFEVPIILDRVTFPFEPAQETALLKLDTPVNAKLGAIDEAVLSITDSSIGEN